MPKKRAKEETKKPLKTPTKAEATERRDRVIEYYETVANCNKLMTNNHFRSEIPSGSLYRIINTHERRKKQGFWTRKRKAPTVTTSENLRKLEELYRMDPNMVSSEACQILNISLASFKNLKSLYKKVKSGSTVNRGSECLIPYPNKWTANAKMNGNGAEKTISGVSAEEGFACGNGHFSDTDPQECSVILGDNDDENEKKVIVTPGNGPQIKPPKKAQRCLVCFNSFFAQKESRTSNKLHDNLNMVFVFKTLLGLSSEELVDILKISDGADPKDWATFCNKCRTLVDEAVAISTKIGELRKRLTECKKEIRETIKHSWSLKSKRKCTAKNLHVTRRVREIVTKRKEFSKSYSQVNPFENGDRQAESMASPVQVPQVQVKLDVEIPDVTDDDDEPGLELTSLSDLEDSLEIAETLKTHINSSNYFESQNSELENDTTVNSNALGSHIMTEPKAREATPTPNNVTNTEILPSNDTRSIIDTAPLPNSTLGICDTCGMEMRPLAIPMHMLMDHGITMEGYSVKYCTKNDCDYKTLYDIHLKRHLRRHALDDNRPFSCSYCPMKFLNRNQLNHHEEIHKNADSRPYVCDRCGSSFAVRNYLYLHKRLSHEKRYFPSTKRKMTKKE